MYRVLLVDDEPFAIEGLQLFINWDSLGFEVIGACENGEEALERILEDQPDIVFTDIRMPVMDGFDLINRVQAAALPKTVHFVVLSGYSEFRYAIKAMEYGVKDYLLKPIIPDEATELLERLFSLLEEEKSQRETGKASMEERLEYALLRLVQGDRISPDEEEWEELQQISASRSAWYYIQILMEDESPYRIRPTLEPYIRSLDLCAYWVLDGLDSVGLICGTASVNDPLIAGLAEEAYSIANKHKPQTAIVAVGASITDLLSIRHAYLTAERALNRHFFQAGVGPVYFWKSEEETAAIHYPADLIQATTKLLEAIEGLDRDKTNAILEEISAVIESKRIAKEWVELFASHLVYKCLKMIKEMNGTPDALIAPIEISHFQRGRLPLYETMRKVKEIAERAVEILKPLQERRLGGGKIFYEIKQYIHDNYSHNLTVKGIAKLFYVNSVYAGQAFQKKFGYSMLDLLHDLRIEEAKRLLLESDRRLSLIADQVGYSHYNHFLKQFEKRTGKKPAQYKGDSMSTKGIDNMGGMGL